jgi:hypothetical protein
MQGNQLESGVALVLPLPVGPVVAPTSYLQMFQVDEVRSGLSGFHIVALAWMLTLSDRSGNMLRGSRAGV